MAGFFNEKKNFGFGCMRLPVHDGAIDTEEFSRMVDAFLAAGFNYFDTAHGYMDGKSEGAVKTCLTSRYPREAYILTDKLSTPYFERQEDIRPLFERQLAACGVTYFDCYLMHAQDSTIYEKFKRCRAYETAFQLKREGLVRHVGLSFHDKAEVLERILTEQPEVEVVQIQFNYVDYDDPAVESRKCYEVCRRFNKPVIVMEPVKGGSLVNLPPDAKKIFDDLGGGSPASYAIRFAAGFEGVMTVLSGMGTMAMVEDNVGYMRDFTPLDDRELAAVGAVRDILAGQNRIQCTACRYCTESCPKHIAIPDLFTCLNTKRSFETWNADYYYGIHTANGGKASDCVRCGRCEAICPQHLPIRALLRDVAKAFE